MSEAAPDSADTRAAESASLNARLQKSMAAIWQHARPEMLSGVAEIEDAVADLLEEHLTEQQRDRAARAAHKIAGAAGMFGYHRASSLARDLEAVLTPDAAPASSTIDRAVAQVNALRAELEDHASPDVPSPRTEHVDPSEVATRRIVIVSTDRGLSGRVATAATARGFGCRRVSDQHSARRVTELTPPDVVLVDVEAGSPENDWLLALGELRASAPGVPIIALTRPRSVIDRLAAARAGVTTFLSAAQSGMQIVDAAMSAVDRLLPARGTVLALDDDAATLAVLERLFRRHSIRLDMVSDPSLLWERIEHVDPDLLVLDLNLSAASGLELCRLVRSDPRWAPLPVVVLTADADPSTIHDIYAAGADDVVTKPVLGPDVLTRVTNRLHRVADRRRMLETDPLTGLTNRRTFDSQVQRLQSRALKHDQPLSFALLDMDQLQGLNAEYGYSFGDSILRRLADVLSESLQADDVASRWSGEEFAVALYGMSRSDGVARVASTLESFRNERFIAPSGHAVTAVFTAAVAEFGVDGTDLNDLYGRADLLVQQAKAFGGDRVLPVGWSPDAAGPPVDVLVVDDDPVQVALITHALAARGYRSEVLTDGHDALRRLTDTSRTTPRVVLLDVVLPGLSGLDVLKRLAGEGALHTSKVIMLTARSSESEVLAALSSGAFDHVAKPYSVPVLMERVRRALTS